MQSRPGTARFSTQVARLFEPMLEGSLLSKLQLQMALLMKKLFYDLEWMYHCLLPKTIMQMKHLPATKFYLSLSAQIKRHNRYSSIINNLKS